jgi:Fungal protein kinase
LIRLISSLAYANVAKFGYDPTMELFWKRDKWNYKITIKGGNNQGKIVTKVYETIDIIADMSSNLRGRATRVYEACDVKNPDTKVVIKDSWVDANRPKEADTLSEILDDASDDEKAMFLTVLIHGVVEIDGREDLTQDLLMNGYLISTDDNSQASSITLAKNFYNMIDELQEMMVHVDITNRRAEDTARVDHTHRASIFEIMKALNPASRSTSLVTSPDVSTSNQMKRPPRVYGPKAHYRIVFKERGESLHSMSRQRQIKLPLVVQAMHDILKGSMDLSNRTRPVNPSNISFILSSGLLNEERIRAPRYQSRKYHHLPGTCEIERSRVCQAV